MEKNDIKCYQVGQKMLIKSFLLCHACFVVAMLFDVSVDSIQPVSIIGSNHHETLKIKINELRLQLTEKILKRNSLILTLLTTEKIFYLARYLLADQVILAYTQQQKGNHDSLIAYWIIFSFFGRIPFHEFIDHFRWDHDFLLSNLKNTAHTIFIFLFKRRIWND